ncbi:hypothetical protein [Pseudobacillus badius]|uniref:hypothetical protein n=1 Tax=Bacillus badius TaxID=1455 RepID=UPI0024A56B54|nr:hypothetical protein [Bacillus badius]GLY11382.1 hypothetical protein Bbad01_25980 [Bacillus badius]
MNDAIKLNIYGIKCDACDFGDSSVKVEDYPEWVNKPCPECGANLLTEADYNNVKMLMRSAKIANSVLPPNESNEESITMSVKMDGTGRMDFEAKE